jgi:fructose-1,6-bisphosphatase II
MLYNGEQIGDGSPPAVDIAVDPIDGTTLTALGRGGAIAVIAMAEKGSMFDPGPCVYMNKIATGPEAADAIDITKSVTANLEAVAAAKRTKVRDLTAVILDRDRHRDLIAEVREAGARVRLIPDGDVASIISTAWPRSGADIAIGIGGTPEGVIAACAVRALGGAMLARLAPQLPAEHEAIAAAGMDAGRVMTESDLVASDDVFFAATGITDGVLLPGVRYTRAGATTASLVIRGRSGTIRTVHAEHRRERLRAAGLIDG